MTVLPRTDEAGESPELPELVDPTADPVPKATVAKPKPLPEPRDLKLSVAGRSLVSEPIILDHFRATIPFTWTDVKKLAGETSFDVKIATSADLAPSSSSQSKRSPSKFSTRTTSASRKSASSGRANSPNPRTRTPQKAK